MCSPYYVFILLLLIYICHFNSIIFHVTHNIWAFCPSHWPSKTFFELVKSSYWFDIRHWKSLSVRRKFCYSTKCLILYHFVMCTWCCFTNHFRRLYMIPSGTNSPPPEVSIQSWKIKKYIYIYILPTTRFWNNLHQVRWKSNAWKTK